MAAHWLPDHNQKVGGQTRDKVVLQRAVLNPSRRVARLTRSLLVNLALVRAFRRSPPDFLDLLVDSGAAEHPMRVGSERVLLIEDATDAWELLTAHAHRTGKGRGLVRARLLLGEGLLTSEAEEHLRQRRALQPAFHATELASYEADFARAARQHAERWFDGGEVDLVAELSALTLAGAGLTLFGSDLRAPAPQITHALSDLLAGFQLAMAPAGPLLLRSPLPVAVRVQAARAALENVVEDLISGRWGIRERRGPVLDLLASQPGLSAGQIRDQVTTLLLAGHETTAMTLVWALAAIDQAPEARRALETEWDTRPDTTMRQVADALPMTLAVLAETLRLWPPSWMISRRVLEPLML